MAQTMAKANHVEIFNAIRQFPGWEGADEFDIACKQYDTACTAMEHISEPTRVDRKANLVFRRHGEMVIISNIQ